MTAAPLTPAENAAARELSRIHNRRDDIPMELEPSDFADEARAVVAAVRPLIAADALEIAAQYLEAHQFLKGERSWPFVELLRGDAEHLRATALSLPASKEHQ